MKAPLTVRLFACALAFGLCAVAAYAQTKPKMKMTTPIPPSIISVETRLGMLKFFDGFPDDATVVLFRRSLRLTQVHVDRT